VRGAGGEQVILRHASLGHESIRSRFQLVPKTPCPDSDESAVLVNPAQRRLGWTERVRSISGNGAIGRGNKTASDGLLNCEKLFIKTTDVDRPSPSELWMFLDENPDSINDGAFFNSQTDRRWIDMPANYHNGAGGLAFVDGHAEIKPWKTTVRMEKPNFTYAPPNVPARDADWGWLLDRTSFNTRAVR